MHASFGVAHHLRLKAVGQDVVDSAPPCHARNRGDAVFGFQNVAGRAVLFLDRQQFFFTAVAEQVFKRFVEGMLFVQRAVGGFAFIAGFAAWPRRSPRPSVDRCRCTRQSAWVFFSPWRSGDQWRAGEGDARGVGEGLEQVVAQVRALRSCASSIIRMMRSEVLTIPKVLPAGIAR